jgi:hypothetical protein
MEKGSRRAANLFYLLPTRDEYVSYKDAFEAKYDPTVWKRISCFDGLMLTVLAPNGRHFDHYKLQTLGAIEAHVKTVNNVDLNAGRVSFDKHCEIFCDAVSPHERCFSFGELVYIALHMCVNEWFKDWHLFICPEEELVLIWTSVHCLEPICMSKHELGYTRHFVSDWEILLPETLDQLTQSYKPLWSLV